MLDLDKQQSTEYYINETIYAQIEEKTLILVLGPSVSLFLCRLISSQDVTVKDVKQVLSLVHWTYP